MALKPDSINGLKNLETAIARDLELLCYPPKPWTREILGRDGSPHRFRVSNVTHPDLFNPR